MASKKQALQGTYAQTRLLLALWDLGAGEQKVTKGQLSKRIVSKGQRMTDYQQIIEHLEADGAITTTKKGATVSYTITTPVGLNILRNGLLNKEFKFDKNVGAWVANALLLLLRQSHSAPSTPEIKASESTNSKLIASYEEFKSVLLEVYSLLDNQYNFDNLVPIYRLRREIGKRVERVKFNQWLVEMQADDILQLISGEIPDFTTDKQEDSILIPGTQLRSYAKLLV
ncbi:hypothetical protein FLX35_06845 [Cylindrospermopsis raciborskii LB2897]|jgi:hypothetical protein|nr:hypothetical protein [Cylindrospermopsis raciborskii LB2897]